MGFSLFGEWASALFWLAPKSARGALVHVDVAPEAKRTALVALLAIPGTGDLVKRAGTHHLTVAIPAAAAWP